MVERGAFRAALRRDAGSGFRFLCEIKKASPSKGVLREVFDPEIIAESYAEAGADALSVLTEPSHFQGDHEYLLTARVTTGIPCLLKDFVVDPYQIEEAVRYGAGAVLLIAAILPGSMLDELIACARETDVDALVEVHDEVELERALSSGADILGINNRDLTTFEVDPQTTIRLAPAVPADVVLVSESGIDEDTDFAALAQVGVDALLVGEHFMRADDPGAALSELRRRALQELEVSS